MCKRTGSGALARAAEAKYRAVKRAAFVDGCMGRGGGACESTRVCRGGERRGRRNARQKQGGWRKHGRFDDERPINDVAKQRVARVTSRGAAMCRWYADRQRVRKRVRQCFFGLPKRFRSPKTHCLIKKTEDTLSNPFSDTLSVYIPTTHRGPS